MARSIRPTAKDANADPARLAVDSVHEAIAIVDRKGIYQFINASGARRFGVAPAAVVGKSMWDFFPKEFAGARLKQLQRIVRTGKSWAGEGWGDVRNKRQWFETELSPIRDAGGKVVSVLVVSRDATEQRKAEETVRDSAVRFRGIFEDSPVGMSMVEPRLRGVRVNRAFARILGYTVAELTRMTVKAITHPDDLEKDMALTALAFAGKIPSFRMEKRYIDKDGQVVWCDTTTTIVDDSQGRHALRVVEDITRRKQIENSLRESEARYRAVVETQDDTIARFRPDTTLTFVNDACCRLWNRTRDDLVGRRFLPMVPRAEHSSIRQCLAQLKPDNPVIRLEHRVVDAEGRPHWFEYVNTGIFDSTGRLVEVQGIGRDVTEERNAREALRESEATARAMLNATSDLAMLLDTRGVILAANESQARSLGLTAAQIVGRRFLDLVEKPERESRRRAIAQALGTSKPARLEGHRHGRCLDGRIYPIFDPKGKVTRLAAFAHDVTEERQAQEELRASKERLQHIIDNTSDVIFQVDLKGRFTFGSKSAERMTGFTLHELMGMGMRDLAAPEFARPLVERLRARLRGNAISQPLTFDIVHKTGRRITVEMATTPLRQDGKVVAIQGISRDVTERKRAEEALAAAHRKLVGAREDERRRVAEYLHGTIGQGLVALQLAIRGMQDDGIRVAHPPKVLSAIAGLGSQCEALLREVRQISHSLYPPTLESLGLRAALAELARDFSARTRIVVRCQSATCPGRLAGAVEIAFFRIAQEAVTNAVVHGHATRITVALACVDGAATVEIASAGRCFDPARAIGKGLGLTAMREHAQSVGGTLEITSRAGRTRVIARAPAALAPAPARK
jgi:PAS domain S-box-containing protein